MTSTRIRFRPGHPRNAGRHLPALALLVYRDGTAYGFVLDRPASRRALRQTSQTAFRILPLRDDWNGGSTPYPQCLACCCLLGAGR